MTIPLCELLIAAKPVPRRGSPATTRTGSSSRVDYSSIKHAGKPHRGKPADEEKRIVKEHFDEINERLEKDGMRLIKLDDSELVERYELQELAAERAAAAT